MTWLTAGIAPHSKYLTRLMHPERLTYIMRGQQCKCFRSWQELCYWKSFIEIYVLTELKVVLYC